MLEGLVEFAVSKIEFENEPKSALMATKSVSQFRQIIVPLFLSAVTFAITCPSFASLSPRFAATFCPFFSKVVYSFFKISATFC